MIQNAIENTVLEFQRRKIAGVYKSPAGPQLMPTAEQVVDDTILHRDVREAERLRAGIFAAPGLVTSQRMALIRRLNDGFRVFGTAETTK